MQINFSRQNYFPKQDPEAYARQYAQKNGLSLDEAKTQLKSKFGDPTEGAQVPYIEQSNNTSIFSSQTNENNNVSFEPSPGAQNQSIFQPRSPMNENQGGRPNPFGTQGPQNPQGINGLESSGGMQQQNPEDFLKQYATENNLTLDEAKAQLESMYGKPQKLDLMG